MNKKNILKKLNTVFKTVFEDCPEITMATQKDDIADWDSIKFLGLIVEMEAAFEVSFDFEEIESFESVKAIVDALEKKL